MLNMTGYPSATSKKAKRAAVTKDIIYNLFGWQKLDSTYAMVGFMDRVQAYAARAVAEDFAFYLPDTSREKLAEFLNPRDPEKRFDFRGVKLVRELSHSGAEKNFMVKSLDPKNLQNGKEYRVKIINVVPDTTNERERAKSFKLFFAQCTCPFNGAMRLQKPSYHHKIYFHDISTDSDIPYRYISSLACKHVLLALDYSADYLNTNSWRDRDGDSYLGASKHIGQVIAPVITQLSQMRAKNIKFPKYRLNAAYRKEGIQAAKPLIYLKNVRVE